MTLTDFLIIAASAYLLGSLNFSIIICYLTLHRDIRAYGSGNAGLTNSFRTMGAGRTVLVLVGDIGKAVAAALIGRMLGGELGVMVGGVFAIIGHVFPVYFGFRGGKGVLCGATLLLMLDWRLFAIAFGLFLIAVLLTRWVSLGSILGAVSFPVANWLFYHNVLMLLISTGMVVAVIYMHRSNISRILQGTENKFSIHGKPKIQEEQEAEGTK